MEKQKSTRRTKRHAPPLEEPVTPIMVDEPAEVVPIVLEGPTPEEIEKARESWKNRPAGEAVFYSKPSFTEATDVYRALLLDRPGVPVITNMQEAIAFIGVYQKWNSKVQTQLK